MAVRESAVRRNHNTILHFTWVISPYRWHKMWFSWSCLGVQGKYKSSFYRQSTFWDIRRFQRYSCLEIVCSAYRNGYK